MPKNIKGFQKGNTLGHGRPKKEICIPDLLRGIGTEPVPSLLLAKVQAKWGPAFHPKTMREALMRVTYAEALTGDSIARQFIAERTEGRVVEKMEVADTTPTKIVFEEVLVDGQVVANTIKRTITRPNDDPS